MPIDDHLSRHDLPGCWASRPAASSNIRASLVSPAGTDATSDGLNHSGNCPDYPMLGFDTQAIYVSTNQFGFSAGFSYAKVRIFDKAELYAGGGRTYAQHQMLGLLEPSEPG